MAAGLVLAVLLAASPLPDPPSPQNRASEVYAGLFAVSPQDARPGVPGTDGAPGTPRKPASLDTRPKTKVVCGMTLIIVGAEPDPGMVKPRPDSGTRYPIKRMPPPACGEEK